MTHQDQEIPLNSAGPLSKIILPELGEHMEEGKVVRWLKQEGEAIRSGEPVVVIETENVIVTIGASQTGTLWRIYKAEGDVVPAGALLALERPDKPIPQYVTIPVWKLSWILLGFIAGGVVLGMFLTRLLLGP